MLMFPPKPTAEQIAAAEKLEAEAAGRIAEKAESFARCDTDGFVSQWAFGLTAEEKSENAKILRSGGYASFPVLCDEDGEVVADKIYAFTNKYSYGMDYRWKVDAEKYGRRWVPVGETSRVQKRLGLTESTRWFPAKAVITGRGTGLSGTAFVTVVRADKE